MLVPLVLGSVLFFIGLQDWRLAVKAKDQPQQISAAQLELAGPGDNAHIVLNRVVLCEWSFVYEASRRASHQDWRWVWVPAVSLDSPYAHQLQSLPPGVEPPPPPSVRIIIKSSKAKSEADVHQLAMNDTLEGMVVNEIESLGSEEKKLLSESYPGIDFSRCWIVQVDRRPVGSGQVLGFMGGGGMLALLGLSLLISQLRK
ncbi:MAG: hypothetical protein K2W85_00050 [Phycisphaerales bacterium]|nr:hypothetical protein [Phycisphaerales bacterium]